MNMKVIDRVLWLVFGLVLTGYLQAQSAQNSGQVAPIWTYTQYPLYGTVVTPTDGVALSSPMAVRADAAGAVNATCAGDGLAGTALTLNLVAGGFFPCQVIEVNDTGTDAITIHGFY